MTDVDTSGWCGSRDDAMSSVIGGGGIVASTSFATSPHAANPQEESLDRASRAKLVQAQAAASKSGLWGPTHSLDSSESGYERYQQRLREREQREREEQQASSPTSHIHAESNPNQGGSAGSERSADAPAARKNGGSTHNHPFDYGSPAQAALESIWNRAGTLFSPAGTGGAATNIYNPTNKSTPTKSMLSSKLDVIGEACSSAPCLSSRRKNGDGDDDTVDTAAEDCTPVCLGIAPMSMDVDMDMFKTPRKQQVNGPAQVTNTIVNTNNNIGTDSTESGNGANTNSNSNKNVAAEADDSPAARRRARHWNRLAQREQLLTKFDEIEVETDFKNQSDQIRVVSPPTDAPEELRQPLPQSQQQLQSQLQQQQQQSQSELQVQQKTAPLQLLEVEHEQAMELERSISELTMRSSYGEHAVACRIPDNRRMAYYAVGKHHQNSGRGGNRRCYFTGKLILGGAPFYAGSVQQGLRTLVVFCLPSALGLPKVTSQADKNAWAKANRGHGNSNSIHHSVSSRSPLRRDSVSSRSPLRRDSVSSRSPLRHPSNRSLSMASHQSSHADQRSGLLSMRSKKSITNNNNMVRGGSENHGSSSVASKSMGMSRMSSLDDLSLSIDGDLDANWSLDRDYLLKVLPEPDTIELKSMATLYPEQFETLPVQVRDAEKWKLYVRFCFFSGLPIAPGEMHYKVRDDIAESSYGEEIVLSHDVMEAVNGESAEILSLPNLKAFRYLRKHYAQQCSKLEGGDRVFLRTSWERVLAEV
jgi:hypothetical protein